MHFVRIAFYASIVAVLSACGVNPVTGKKEIQFVSEAQELKIGEQHYAPTRQAEGGDLTIMPELTAYVSEVGQKLAAVADRKLPYEFTVLNNSVPNAWALPGGKIAVNRGLLTELNNEAELAAVLGHEIVHAAARHGARAQERGILLQAGLATAQIGAAIGGVDSNVAGLAIAGAGLGAQLVQQKYGRDQELESDQYGMKYMKLAGYDPSAAISLQQTFVRLSEGRQTSWLEGLFASHPPSLERVERNTRTADEMGREGEVGQERYAAKTKALRDAKPAYDKYDEAVAATRKNDFARAKSLANEAIRALPREGRFHELLGEIALAEKQPQAALPHYQKAIDLNPNYFGSYLGAGIAQLQSGNQAKAEEWLTKSAQLLPTAPAAYYLGNLYRERGDAARATEQYRAAASSNSQIGQLAATELVRMDLPQNPGNYVGTSGKLDVQGRPLLVVQNRSSVSLSNIQVTPLLVDPAGRILQQAAVIKVSDALKPGEHVAVYVGLGTLTQEQLASVRFRVEHAQVAE